MEVNIVGEPYDQVLNTDAWHMTGEQIAGEAVYGSGYMDVGFQDGGESLLEKAKEELAKQREKAKAAAKEELAKQVKYFNDRNTETQRDTIWKIKDVEKLLNSRISEQKVNTLLTRLSKDLTSDMTMADNQLAEKIKAIEQQFKTKTDNFQSLSNLRIDQLRVEIHNYK